MGRKSKSAPPVEIEEQKVNVDGIDINYFRAGKGDHVLFLIPGALGSGVIDFKPQIERLDKEKFTIVTWDPPGHGKSRPPDRDYPDNYFERDADWGYNLMKTLGYKKYSVLGWSDGGTTALIFAAKYTDTIRKLIVTATNSYILPEELEFCNTLRDLETWSHAMRTQMIDLYGEDYLRKTWELWADTQTRLYKEQNGNLCTEMLPRITCDTLIFYGMRDPLVLPEQATYLRNNIKHSISKLFPRGHHDLHLVHFEEFNEYMYDFLTCCPEY